MRTQYVSDSGKIFDSEEECKKDELAISKKKEDRAKRAKEVEDAIKTEREARKNANKLIDAFVADYGHFNYSWTEPMTFESAFDHLFDTLMKF